MERGSDLAEKGVTAGSIVCRKVKEWSFLQFNLSNTYGGADV